MRDNLSFEELSTSVLDQLKSQGYMDSTIIVYRRTFNRIRRFMESVGNEMYTKQVGDAFLTNSKVCESTMVAYRCAVRRLNDYIDGKPYICHVLGPDDYVPEAFGDILGGFIDLCEDEGNKPLTIKAKRHTCALFLQFIESNGCTNLMELSTEIVSKSLSIYTNRDNYARLRLFLKYLSDEGITKTDFSVIIPHYKRRKPVPTAYTPEEVLRIEGSIDDSSDTGKRNLAIVRLASRMGYRAGDIAKLKWSEIDFSTGYISIIQEKTGIPLVLQMPHDVVDALKSHAGACTRNYNSDYVFQQMAAPYNHISTAIVRHAVNDAIKASGINYSGKKHGSHALRSSLASSMVNDGASYETVRRILGHSDPDIIKHYAKADIENLRKCSIIPPQPSGRFGDFLNGEGAM